MEKIVAIGAAILALPVLVGLLVSFWPRPDTRKRRNPSASEMLGHAEDNYRDVPWPHRRD
jgi:hypothetical protein